MKPIDRETVERVLAAAYFNCWRIPYGDKIVPAHVDSVLETVNRTDQRPNHPDIAPVPKTRYACRCNREAYLKNNKWKHVGSMKLANNPCGSPEPYRTL